ncbi:MAG: hypothetical protein HP041_06235 [Oscillospiraceae bacterium]|nr:hypothetical protein [Oscillospiraceae bacterium]
MIAARLFVRYNRQDAGVLWLVVKQDSPSLGLSPLDCAKASREHLGSLS